MLTVRVRSGARMGEVLRFKGPRVTVGRHPQADLRFGPNTDLEVSTFHAAFAEDAEGWFVRDLGSRNGTWVDGERVEGDRRIRGGETIQFGTGGPSCGLSLGKGGVDEAPEVEPPAPETREKVDGHESFTSIVRREVSRRTHRLSLLSALAVLVLLGAVTFVVLRSRSRMAEWESQRQVLRERLDSALRQADSASSSGNARIGGLSDALESSRERIRSLQEELDRARDASARELESLRRRLQAATAALERQQLAASVDFQEIYDRNWRAVALLYVEFAGGEVVSGTAFAVDPDGTLVTARHMITGDEGGERPRRIAVQFAGSRQVWPARLTSLDREHDLALLQVENVAGAVPTVAGIAAGGDSLSRGDPVALLGFPLGGAPDPDEAEGGAPPRPLLSVGLVDRPGNGVLEIQGYGERGASGSPIFDETGRVVGVLFGGRTGPVGTSNLVGVPAAAVTRLLGEDR